MSLSADIIENILNLYLDWNDDIPKLKELFPKLKFKEEHHLRVEEFKDNGKIIIDTYRDNKKIKTVKYFSNGNKEYEWNYKNGKLNGKQYRWFENKNQDYETNYLNDLLEGVQYYWYLPGRILSMKNEHLKHISNYKDGVEEGTHFSYWSNGNIRSVENYKNGKFKGKQYEYNEDGVLEVEAEL